MPKLTPDSPRVVILLPELRLTFKEPPSLIRPGGALPEIRRWWQAAASTLRGDLRGLGFNAEVLEVPGWEITPTLVDRLGADLALVPHRTARTWPGGKTPVLFWAQAWLPWLFTLDPKGWGAELSTYPVAAPEQDGGAMLRWLISEVRDKVSKFPQPAPRGFAPRASTDPGSHEQEVVDPFPPEPFVFFPCQIPHDENVLQHSDVDEVELVREVADWARRASGAPVVFKAHPANPDSCLPLREATKPHGDKVRWLDCSVHEALRRCAAVFTINSGVGFEAMLHNRPVVCWGRAEYDTWAIRASSVDWSPAGAWEAARAQEPKDLQRRAGAFLRHYLEHVALDVRTNAASRSRPFRVMELAQLGLSLKPATGHRANLVPMLAEATGKTSAHDEMLARRLFIGWDTRQALAPMMAMGSAILHSTRPLQITPLVLETLPITNQGLTPFTFSRFLVPWLCGYQGWALFVDADVLFRCDVEEVFKLADAGSDVAVIVAKLPEAQGYEQAAVMLFNCAHPDNRKLTPESVQARQGTMIDWTEAVGFMPPRFNHLVGYAEPRPHAGIVHFTQGIPAFPETQGCEHTDSFLEHLNALTAPIRIGTAQVDSDAWVKLMGRSVHAVTLPGGRVLPRLHPDAVPVEQWWRDRPAGMTPAPDDWDPKAGAQRSDHRGAWDGPAPQPGELAAGIIHEPGTNGPVDDEGFVQTTSPWPEADGPDEVDADRALDRVQHPDAIAEDVKPCGKCGGGGIVEEDDALGTCPVCNGSGKGSPPEPPQQGDRP